MARSTPPDLCGKIGVVAVLALSWKVILTTSKTHSGEERWEGQGGPIIVFYISSLTSHLNLAKPIIHSLFFILPIVGVATD